MEYLGDPRKHSWKRSDGSSNNQQQQPEQQQQRRGLSVVRFRYLWGGGGASAIHNSLAMLIADRPNIRGGKAKQTNIDRPSQFFWM